MEKNYRVLRNEARLGTPEHGAYTQIVKALESDAPVSELQRLIQKTRDAIAENDQRVWNSRDGYRGYYNRQIELYQEALAHADEIAAQWKEMARLQRQYEARRPNRAEQRANDMLCEDYPLD